MAEETTLILYFFVGGVVSADTEAAWQSMVSQPLVACAIAGLLFGDVILGSSIGLLLQLPYLAEAPLGGCRISNASLGAFVAAGLALRATPALPDQPNLVLVVSLAYGIMLSWIASNLAIWLRRVNYRLIRLADHAAAKGAVTQITRLNFVGVLIAFAFGVGFCVVFFFVGEALLLGLFANLPAEFDSKLTLVRPALLGAGLGVASRLFLQKKSLKALVIGAAVALLLVITIKS